MRDRKNILLKQGGFTLIELMIVVAIAAILTLVASASYRSQVVRSNRAAVESFMLEVANREERYLLDNRSYTDDLSKLGMSEPSEVDGNYNITIAFTVTPPFYTITATAIGGQATGDSDCGNLTLNAQGVKTASGGGSRCWK